MADAFTSKQRDQMARDATRICLFVQHNLARQYEPAAVITGLAMGIGAMVAGFRRADITDEEAVSDIADTIRQALADFRKQEN